MTPWWDKRSELKKKGDLGKALHALVIGTSRYDGHDLTQLDTVATGAYAFARWLKSTYHNEAHPLGTIRLRLSPAAGEKEARAAGVGGTKTEDVWREMNEWRDSCRETGPQGMALLFVAGHGYEWGDGHSAILLQDYRAGPRAMDFSLDVARVCDGLQGMDYPRDQLYFVDACRGVPHQELSGEGLGWPPDDDRGLPARPIFFAAVPGAYAQAGGGSTVFTECLLQCLKGEGATNDAQGGPWFVSTWSLGEALGDAVPRLAQAGDKVQRPVMANAESIVIHQFRNAPRVHKTIRVDPPRAAGVARATLLTSGRAARVFEDVAFGGDPIVRSIKAGSYLLDILVDPDAGFHQKKNLVCSVRPRSDPQTVRLTR